MKLTAFIQGVAAAGFTAAFVSEVLSGCNPKVAANWAFWAVLNLCLMFVLGLK